jgi:glycosyltransferase involved in cell wall biosynthesis
MDPANRIGAADAAVILFNKGGRDFRIERLARGQEVPREFFYGYFDLERAGISCAMMSSAGRLPGASGLIADTVERAFARFTAIGVKPVTTRLAAPRIGAARVLISFTDGFSLSLGLGYPRRAGTVLMGGFHGLSDIEERAPEPLRGVARRLITRALAGLDHAFFFGPADREVAIARYGLQRERSSIFPFGIDTEFWRPLPEEPQEDYVFAVGQDHNRDYNLLAAAPGDHPIRIVTRQPVKVPAGATNVSISSGDFFGSDSMTDEALRRLYNRARAVVVPLKDVYQPTGYSVTLQAMSAGRAVILSDIKGLWAPELLRHEENCLLVPPHDAAALAAAIARLRGDAALRARLGSAARAAMLTHFGLDRMGRGTVALAELGLSLASAR